MMNILYELDNALYINITNACPCKCLFCIRESKDEISNSGSLWLEKEPTLSEIIEAFNNVDLNMYEEVVFCGYGEPLVRLDEVIAVCDYIKSKSSIKIRMNTNGLGNLIHKKNIVPILKDKIDSISISLNAPTKEEYLKVTNSSFGEKSFDSLLDFAREAKGSINNVAFSIVDVLAKEDIKKCIELAKSMDIELKIRKKQ